jgi:transcriptional regulator with GAF, ATPase, and Fis domain
VETQLTTPLSLTVAAGFRAQLTRKKLIHLVEREWIRQLLARNGGNQCKAARESGDHRNTIKRVADRSEINPHAYKTRKPPRSVPSAGTRKRIA